MKNKPVYFVIYMNRDLSINKIQKNTLSAVYSDGAIEISIGSMLIFVTFITTLSQINSAFYILVLLLSSFSKIIDYIKNTYTFPRTGYVEINETRNQLDLKRSLAVMFSITVIFFVTLILYEKSIINFYIPSLLPLFLGILLSTLFFFLRKKSMEKHYLIYLIGTITLGISFSLYAFMRSLPGFWLSGVIIYIFFLGLSISLHGIYLLRLFTITHQIIKDE